MDRPVAVPEPCVSWEAPQRPEVLWSRCKADDGSERICTLPEAFKAFITYDIERDLYINRVENECAKKEQTDGTNSGN